MGCCPKGLLRQPLTNKTELYYLCPEGVRKRSKEINIRLEDDVLLLEPNKDDVIETPNILKYETENGQLCLLKDESGIVTRQSRIRESFEEIIDRAARNYQSIVFNEPKVNEDNKLKLYRDLINSAIQYDMRRDGRRLKAVYIPWQDLAIEEMKRIIEQQLANIEILE